MQRLPWAPGRTLDGRLGLRKRSQGAPGDPSGGRLGRQEARRQAVWAARRPESSVLPTVRAKMQVLRRLQAGRRLQARGSGLQSLKIAKHICVTFV